MRRQSIVLLAGALGLLAVGCNNGENTTVAESPSPQAESSPATTQPFNNPTISQKDSKDGKVGKDGKKIVATKTNKIAGLLESTDPEERAKQVQAGIRSRAGLDPFASLPATLSFNLPVDSTANGSGGSGNVSSFGSGGRPRLGPLVAGNGGGGGFNGGNGGGGRSPLIGFGSNGGGGPRGGGVVIGSVPSIPAFPEVAEVRRPVIAIAPVGTSSLNTPGKDDGLKPLPPLPEPKLAQAVEVTGVVTIGGITQAIIKAPNEPTGRHVEVGQRLSNGQVLVKRIEANAGTDPIVVFEENGQEVSRGVGEKATPDDGPTV